jgi:GNAT superfamily N-acetyltransferase
VAITRNADEPAYVARLFVTPQARRYGVASVLLGAASARGLELVLEIEDGGKAAIALYARSGWCRVGTAESDWTTADGRTALRHAYAAQGSRLLGEAGERAQ